MCQSSSLVFIHNYMCHFFFFVNYNSVVCVEDLLIFTFTGYGLVHQLVNFILMASGMSVSLVVLQSQLK
jgi:hypothetical protein